MVSRAIPCWKLGTSSRFPFTMETQNFGGLRQTVVSVVVRSAGVRGERKIMVGDGEIFAIRYHGTVGNNVPEA